MIFERKLEVHSIGPRQDKNGNQYYLCILLDDQADKYNYYIPSEEYKNYSSLKKGDIVNCEFNLYKKDSNSYSLYVNGIKR